MAEGIEVLVGEWFVAVAVVAIAAVAEFAPRSSVALAVVVEAQRNEAEAVHRSIGVGIAVADWREQSTVHFAYTVPDGPVVAGWVGVEWA